MKAIKLTGNFWFLDLVRAVRDSDQYENFRDDSEGGGWEGTDFASGVLAGHSSFLNPLLCKSREEGRSGERRGTVSWKRGGIWRGEGGLLYKEDGSSPGSDQPFNRDPDHLLQPKKEIL